MSALLLARRAQWACPELVQGNETPPFATAVH